MTPASLELLPAIYDTWDDVQKWQDVLKALIETTGAAKGMLSVREAGTRGFVIAEPLTTTGCGPVQFGFSNEEIESYATRYVDFDPWTDIENLRRPVRPYALSAHLDENKLRSSRFWEWLEPQGVSESVVCEIASRQGYWIALNILFAADERITRRTLDTLTDLQPAFRKAWRLGEVYRETETLKRQQALFLEQYHRPCAMVRRDGSILAMNSEARQYFSGKSNMFRIVQDRIVMLDMVLRQQFEAALVAPAPLPCATDGASAIQINLPDHRWYVSCTGQAENVLGFETGMKLVVVASPGAGDEDLPIWEHPDLTFNGRKLVRHLAHGGTIIGFAKHTGLTRHGADYHWRRAKLVLGVSNVKEIFAAHHRYLASRNHDDISQPTTTTRSGGGPNDVFVSQRSCD
ncbi:MAG: hypothetical protein ACR2O4_17150 [Hyphomicrobiaceae bacterium]